MDGLTDSETERGSDTSTTSVTGGGTDYHQLPTISKWNVILTKVRIPSLTAEHE